MVINVQVQGLERLKKKIEDKTRNLSNLQPFWQSVGEYMKTRTIKECFDKEQSPDGEKWKPIKHRQGKILQDTGELKKSIQYEADNSSVTVGSKLIYARAHQFGRGKIPARPFLGVTEDDKKHIAQMIKIFLKRGG